MIEPVVLVALVAIIGILVFILFQTRKSPRPAPKIQKGGQGAQKMRPCPLCGELLAKGQTVKTVVYPAEGDTLAEVFGCLHCYGDSASAIRTCPVCLKPVPDDGFVIGRMFKEGRHLHVLGCTRCRGRGRR